jgi:hypothetical protein
MSETWRQLEARVAALEREAAALRRLLAALGKEPAPAASPPPAPAPPGRIGLSAVLLVCLSAQLEP